MEKNNGCSSSLKCGNCTLSCEFSKRDEEEESKISREICEYDLSAKTVYEYLEKNNMLDSLKKITRVRSVLRKYDTSKPSDAPYFNLEGADILFEFKYIDGTPLGKYKAYEEDLPIDTETKTCEFMSASLPDYVARYEFEKIDLAMFMFKIGLKPIDVAKYHSKKLLKKIDEEKHNNSSEVSHENVSETSSEYIHELERIKNEYIKAKKELKKTYKKQVKTLSKQYKKMA